MNEAALQPGWPSRTAAWTVVCFLLLPIVVVFPLSLTDREYISLPEQTISFQYYWRLFTSDAWLSSFGESFMVAFFAMIVSVVAGTLCAVGCWKLGSRTSELVRLFMLVPLMVPPVVYALGLYRFWVDLRLLSTYLGVVIAHGVTGMPFVVIIVSTALASFDVRLYQAARSLGATSLQTLRLVLLPNIMPAIASSAIFAFVHSWDELLLVLFIAGREIFTLPRRIWDGINDTLDPTIAAVAAVLLILTVVLLFLDLKARRRGSAP